MINKPLVRTLRTLRTFTISRYANSYDYIYSDSLNVRKVRKVHKNLRVSSNNNDIKSNISMLSLQCSNKHVITNVLQQVDTNIIVITTMLPLKVNTMEVTTK